MESHQGRVGTSPSSQWERCIEVEFNDTKTAKILEFIGSFCGFSIPINLWLLLISTGVFLLNSMSSFLIVFCLLTHGAVGIRCEVIRIAELSIERAGRTET